MSIAGIFVKLNNPTEFNLDEITIMLFGEFISNSEICPSGFDIRNQENRILSRYKNGVSIADADIVNQILVEGNKELIAKIFGYFNQPQSIIAYMHYDSGDSFGFRYIENGWTKRYCYKIDGMQTVEYGVPLPEEIKILNRELFYQGDIEDEFLCYYIDEERTQSNAYHFRSSALACEVMRSKIGHDFYDESVKRSSIYYTYEKEIIPKKPVKEERGILRMLFRMK